MAIGTGRIALPLAARGVEVHGIDSSEAMVEQLREKPGGEAIPVTMGDFVEFDLQDRYSLIYAVFNTFFAPLTQEEQVKCFMNVARHLTDGGFFVIEAFVPDVARFVGGQCIRADVVNTDTVSIDVSRHDPAAQMVTSSHVYFTEDGVRLYPVKLRYAWPSELDLMGQPGQPESAVSDGVTGRAARSRPRAPPTCRCTSSVDVEGAPGVRSRDAGRGRRRPR